MKDSKQSALHLIRRTVWTATISSLAFLGSIAGTAAQVINVNLDAPSIDKNGYPFSGSGGGPRQSAFTFGAIGSAGFDDRDAQFFNRFDTAGIVPSGQGFATYEILSATFTLSIKAGDVLVFDGTYDSFTTYDATTGAPINDSDAGRPIELYGAAFRNGITKALVEENLPFSPPDGARNIYATDFQLGASLDGTNRDVSNNIEGAFDPVPFAIGQVDLSNLNPDGTVKVDADVVFTLNLASLDVLRYLQLSLDAGSVDLVVTSLHLASQGGPVAYPEFYTKESLIPDSLPGRLDIQVVVPEASTVTLLLCAFGLFVGLWRGRQAIQAGGSNP